MKPVERTSGKDTAQKEHSPCVSAGNGARCSVAASVLSRTPLMPVVGLDSQEEYTALAAVASLLYLVADELGSLAFKVDLYT